MRTKTRIPVVLALLLVLAASTHISTQTTPRALSQTPGNNILARGLAIELGQVQPAQYERLLSSGAIYAALQASGELERRANAESGAAGHNLLSVPVTGTSGCPNVFGGLNIRVNQDCSLRRQAEEVVVINPKNPNNLIAGQNDSRIGFNHCGYAFSFDGGQTWGDQIPPFWQFTLLDDHTADACSDPTATFDADGNAYVGGIIFDVAAAANGIVVAKSNAPIGGAFYHTPAALSFQTYRNVPLGVVANDDNPNIFHDKEFIVADANAGSPKKNNVYATWTRFTHVHSPIFFSQSTNGGRTWSPGIEISGANPAICTAFSRSDPRGACDQDQGSHPIVGPDGTVYVVFGNGNTPLRGINQVVLVKCPASANCANPAGWTAPVKVGNLIGTHPIGPSAAGCPAGRQCLPTNGYRVPEFTSMSASVDNGGRLYVAWSDSRNIGANCDFDADGDGDADLGSAATATPPCDNDVFYAFSTDGGANWSATRKITPAGSAQWQPWSGVVADGSKLWVAYYDRSYGTCESTGCNDITLAAITNPASASPAMSFTRLTTSSMPNLTPANNPVQAGFLGDYMWVAVDQTGKAHVVWADTRGLGGTVEEDIYYATSP